MLANACSPNPSRRECPLALPTRLTLEAVPLPTQKKLDRIHELLLGTPRSGTDLSFIEEWRQRSVVLLRRALGPDHPLTAQANTLSFTMRSPLFASFPNAEALDLDHRAQKVNELCSILRAAEYEVKLDADELQPPPEAQWIHSGLWRHVDTLVLASEWEKVVSQACIFFEDWVRRKAGLPNHVVGLDLMTAAFGATEAPLTLGGGLPAGEGQGWTLLAKGLALAIRNPAGHRIEERSDAERYAMGVLGLVTLLMTQVEQEHP